MKNFVNIKQTNHDLGLEISVIDKNTLILTEYQATTLPTQVAIEMFQEIIDWLKAKGE